MRPRWLRVDPLHAPVRVTRHALHRWRLRGGEGELTAQRVREAARREGVTWRGRACYVRDGDLVLVGLPDEERPGGVAILTVLYAEGWLRRYGREIAHGCGA